MVFRLEYDGNMQHNGNVKNKGKTMFSFLKRHKETLLVALMGLLVMAALNAMMLQYHYEVWTNPKVGFWSAFYNRFEVSGFDPLTYIVISKWRPLYILFRHPLLALIMWPLAELNGWLMAEYDMNCTIFIVAVVWTLLALASWLLMFRILRRLIRLSLAYSLLLTAWFFSFSHIMLVTFTPDHFSITLPLLLLTVYLAGSAVRRKKAMPLWQSLPLLFVATGVTTTNMIKVAVADTFTQWGRKPLSRLILHFMAYLLPLAVIAGLYFYQENTVQIEEQKSNNELMIKKAKRDSVFAKQWEKEKVEIREKRARQIVNIPIVTNTEHHIDRIPSLVENILGEGIILHEDYALMDSNKTRPALVRYNHWWYYVLEAMTVLLFAVGVWSGRRKRLMWMTMTMFLFDMVLHIGLQFANADAYIMTAHWAFVMPIAVAYLLKGTEKKPVASVIITCMLIFLTVFSWGHNLKIIVEHIVK